MKTFQTPLGSFLCYDTGIIPRALEAGQWWDHHLKAVLDEDTDQDVAIDIGAHIGWFTIYLARQIRRPLVIACEPWPATFALLQANVDGQPLKVRASIQCWPVAAYDRMVPLSFATQNDVTDPGAWGFIPTAGADRSSVLGMALDSYIPSTQKISLIKCDAQGADLRALKGLERTIKRCRPLIVFEWEEGMAAWQGDLWAHYMDFFNMLNYAVERITPDYYDFVARPR